MKLWAWFGAALLATGSGGLVAGPVSAAEGADAPPPIVEDFAYPGAGQIPDQHGLKVFKGDGNIRFVAARTFDEGQCPVGLIQVEQNLAVDPYGVYYCFQTLASQGFLTLQVPGTFGVRGGNRPVEATAQLPEGIREFNVPPNTPVPINPGSGNELPKAVLVELRVAEATAPAGTPSSHPFVAQVTMGERACSGVLVAPRWVATAKGCFDDDSGEVGAGKPPLRATAVVGRAQLTTSGGHSAEIVELVPRADRDLVLARLASPAANIAPIDLAAVAPEAGQAVQAAGYGRAGSDWPGQQLRVGAFTVAAATAGTVELHRAPGTPAGTCKGDAGGPAFRMVDGRAQLIGVHSRSWQAGCPGVTGTQDAAVTTRTDDIAGWIRENTLDACQTTVEDGFTPLYDGRSAPVAQWQPVGQGSAVDADCELSPSGGATLLQFTGRRMPAAFTLRLDWKATARTADSGVVVGLPRTAEAARGVEVQINPAGTGTDATGAVRELKAPTAAAERSLGSWNTYEIAVAQRRLTVRLNGTLVNDYAVTDTSRLLASGFVALQADAERSQVRFRNIRVRADQPGSETGTVPALYDYGNALTRLWHLGNVAGQPVTTRVAWESGAGSWDAARSRPVLGDFDGDGHNDIAVFYNYDGARTKLWLFSNATGSGPISPRMVWDSGAGNWDWNRAKPVAGDFDGDGKSEIAALYNYDGALTRLWLFKNVSGTVSTPMVWDSGRNSWDWNRSKPVAGDFDGDGKSEIAVFYNYDGALTRLWLFKNVTGTLSTPMVWESGPGNWDWHRGAPVVGDFDGDGKSEIAAFYNYDGGQTKIWLFKNVTGTVSTPMVWDSGRNNWDWNRAKPLAGDFDGDGKSEIVAFYNYDGALTKLWRFTNVTGSPTITAPWTSGAGNWDWNRTTIIP